jgi:hypothetical protein
MKSRALLLVPLAGVALYFVAAHFAGGGDRNTFYFGEALITKTVALIACIVAALRFEPGDRMRTIWMLFVADFALLLLKELVVHPATAAAIGPSSVAWLRAVCLIGANVAGTFAWIVLARTWRVAGLTLDSSPAAQRAILFVAIAAGIVLVSWGTMSDVRALLGGNKSYAINVLSDLADVVGFSLAAPVALTAWTLRGGSLSWPYVYLTTCTFTWMLFDIAQALRGTTGAARSAEEILRIIACSLHVSAAVATRWAVRRPSAAIQPQHDKLSA